MPKKIISKILAQITPERIEKEIKAIQKIKLPPHFEKLVKGYEKVGGKRDKFIWKALIKVNRNFNYITVPQKYKKNIEEIRFLIALLIVLLDDVVDNTKNTKLLNELLKIVSYKQYINLSELNEAEKTYLNFTIYVKQRIDRILKKSPQYKKFIAIFQFDINQILNAMNYDHLLNTNEAIINKTEYWLYSPHTMKFITTATIYLMYASKIDIKKLGELREVAWEAQKMARIGNWVGTWEREVYEDDFSSGVFAYALQQKIITEKDLEDQDKSKLISKIQKSNIEDLLLQEWENSYHQISQIKNGLKINIKNFLVALEQLLFFELILNRYIKNKQKYG